MVRFRGGGGGEILRRHFQEFEDREDCPLSKRSGGKNWPAARIGHDGGVYARQSRVRGAQPRKRSGQFKFTEAISFAVNCETQDEVDYFWEKLSVDGGSIPKAFGTGSKTNSDSPGRSTRSFSAICWPIPIKRKQH